MTHLPAPRRRRLLAVLTAGASPSSASLRPRPRPPPCPATTKWSTPSRPPPRPTSRTARSTRSTTPVRRSFAGGSFTRVQNRNSDVDIARDYLLAFDKATGAVDTAFAPTLDNEVTAVTAGPTAGHGLRRRQVQHRQRRDPAQGGPARRQHRGGRHQLRAARVQRAHQGHRAGRQPAAGRRHLHHGRQPRPRGGLASLNADHRRGGQLPHHHADREPQLGRRQRRQGRRRRGEAGRLPGRHAARRHRQLQEADGVLHDQIVKIDLGATAATVADWNTARYTPRCKWQSFDSWVRDVAFSPDDSYFVIVTTGGPYSGTLCDTASRWEAGATGTNLQPDLGRLQRRRHVPVSRITRQAVYVGGHLRWMNNTTGADNAPARRGRPGQHRRARPGQRPAAVLEPRPQPARHRRLRDVSSRRPASGSAATRLGSATSSTAASGSRSSRWPAGRAAARTPRPPCPATSTSGGPAAADELLYRVNAGGARRRDRRRPGLGGRHQQPQPVPQHRQRAPSCTTAAAQPTGAGRQRADHAVQHRAVRPVRGAGDDSGTSR